MHSWFSRHFGFVKVLLNTQNMKSPSPITVVRYLTRLPITRGIIWSPLALMRNMNQICTFNFINCCSLMSQRALPTLWPQNLCTATTFIPPITTSPLLLHDRIQVYYVNQLSGKTPAPRALGYDKIIYTLSTYLAGWEGSVKTVCAIYILCVVGITFSTLIPVNACNSTSQGVMKMGNIKGTICRVAFPEWFPICSCDNQAPLIEASKKLPSMWSLAQPSSGLALCLWSPSRCQSLQLPSFQFTSTSDIQACIRLKHTIIL